MDMRAVYIDIPNLSDIAQRLKGIDGLAMMIRGVQDPFSDHLFVFLRTQVNLIVPGPGPVFVSSPSGSKRAFLSGLRISTGATRCC
jgi:hypothetical protein